MVYKVTQMGEMGLPFSFSDVNDLEQDCSISSALAMEILQSCTKRSMCPSNSTLIISSVSVHATIENIVICVSDILIMH